MPYQCAGEKNNNLLTFSIILGYSLLPSGNKIHQAAIPLFCSKFVQSELYCSLLCTTRSLEWPAAFSPLPEESGVLSWLKSQKEWGHDVENPACYWSQQTVTNNTPMNAHGNLYVTDMYEGHFIHVFLYRQGGVMIVLLCYKGFTQGRHFLRNGFVFIQALQWSVWPWHLLRTKKLCSDLSRIHHCCAANKAIWETWESPGLGIYAFFKEHVCNDSWLIIWAILKAIIY